MWQHQAAWLAPCSISKGDPDWCLQKLAEHSATVLQIADAVWMSMLLSAFAGILAVTVVVATFYFIRWVSILIFTS